MRLALALLAIASLGGCARVLSLTPERVDLPRGEARVPIRLVHGLPIVEVRVDGGAPRTFILDLGATGSIVSQRLAAQLPHQASTHIDLYDAAGRTSAGDRRVVRLDLGIGAVTLRDATAIAVDLDPFSALIGFPVDGLLGWELFQHLLLTIDYPARQLSIARGRLPDADGVEIVPVTFERALPTVLVTIGTRTQRLVVDTGATSRFDLPPEAAAGLPTVAPWAVVSSSTNLLGKNSEAGARLAIDIQLGRHHFVRPIVARASGGARIGGLALQSFVLTFDATHALMRFHRDATGPITMSSRRSAGISMHKVDGHWAIDEILDGTPAATLDLRVGDRVLTLDGRPCDAFSIDEWIRAIEGQPALALGLERDGHALSVVLPTIELVR